jgi:hypothetical protein
VPGAPGSPVAQELAEPAAAEAEHGSVERCVPFVTKNVRTSARSFRTVVPGIEKRLGKEPLDTAVICVLHAIE